jgi:hypothetical protein
MTPQAIPDAGTDPALVEDEDVAAVAETAGLELSREMPGGGEPVDPGTDDDVTAAGRNGGHWSSPSPEPT